MPETVIPHDDIERALHNGELCFYYQPKISFLDGKISGAEALLRWKRADGSLVSPDSFLPDAENSGFITTITAVMLVTLIDDIEHICKTKPDIRVAFNVSARDLFSPYLAKMLHSFIGNKRISADNIQIEITESAFLDKGPQTMATLRELVAMGIDIVMDDFGTGYASLDILSQIPFSALKIDQGVVRRMAVDAKNTHIVRSSIYLAREMGVKTVAEGVESAAAYRYLLASGCNEAQGFWMSRPLPLDGLTALIARQPSWPSSGLGILYNAWVNHLSYRRKILESVFALAMGSADPNNDRDDWRALPRLGLRHAPEHCQLDQWILNEGRQYFTVEDYQCLRTPHALMHEVGEKLIKAARAPSPPALIAEMTQAFLSHSEAVDAVVSKIVGQSFAHALTPPPPEQGPGRDIEPDSELTSEIGPHLDTASYSPRS